jgi:glutamyl-tRNA synthetase
VSGDGYRGRIAPSPTGLLHIGHAVTFWTAQERAAQHGGELILRVEDLDRERCRSEYGLALLEDLRWAGLCWSAGPDVGGPEAPYVQSERNYFHIWDELRRSGFLYPCACSRRDVLSAVAAPHAAQEEEPLYPGTCRPPDPTVPTAYTAHTPRGVNWRFRVPDRETLRFQDGARGEHEAVAGRDFGDFIVWRKDDIPAYQIAVVADDAGMRITEVVRGADLLLSTFRQILLYRALGIPAPAFYHVPLVVNEKGERLAKRDAALSLRALRQSGVSADELRERWFVPAASEVPAVSRSSGDRWRSH